MAPDKIYIDNNVFPTHVDWDGSPINTKRIESSDIEYIRKDALLEWAKGQASITKKLNGKGAMLKAWDTLIGKVNSM